MFGPVDPDRSADDAVIGAGLVLGFPSEESSSPRLTCLGLLSVDSPPYELVSAPLREAFDKLLGLIEARLLGLVEMDCCDERKIPLSVILLLTINGVADRDGVSNSDERRPGVAGCAAGVARTLNAFGVGTSAGVTACVDDEVDVELAFEFEAEF